MSYHGIFTHDWVGVKPGDVWQSSHPRQVTGFGAAATNAPKTAAPSYAGQRPPVVPANLPRRGDGKSLAFPCDEASRWPYSTRLKMLEDGIKEWEKHASCCAAANVPYGQDSRVRCNGEQITCPYAADPKHLKYMQLLRRELMPLYTMCKKLPYEQASQRSVVATDAGPRYWIGHETRFATESIPGCFIDNVTGLVKWPVSYPRSEEAAPGAWNDCAFIQQQGLKKFG